MTLPSCLARKEFEMPIYGVTDEDSRRKRAMYRRRPEVGRLHKGSEKGTSRRGGWQGGDNMPFFRFTSKDDKVLETWRSAFPDKPEAIRVFFVDDEVDAVFDTWIDVKDGGGRLLMRSDGKFLLGRAVKHGDTLKWEDLTGQNVPFDPNTKGARKTGYLHCVVPELVEAGHYGIVLLQTTSAYDVYHISSELQAAFDRFGTLRGHAFIIYRSTEKITQPDGTTRNDHLVKLCLAEDYEAKIATDAQVNIPTVEGDPDPNEGDDDLAEILAEEYAAALGADDKAPAPESVDVATGEIVTTPPAPTTLIELWSTGWQTLYDAKPHAQNVMKKYGAGLKDVGDIWAVLVEHSPKRKALDISKQLDADVDGSAPIDAADVPF